MIDSIAHFFRDAAARWVDLSRRFAAAVVLLAVLLTIGLGWYAIENASINTDTSDMLSPDLPFRRHSLALSEAFPQFSDNILIVIEGDAPDAADDAAAALVARLRQAPELFGSVYDLAGDPFLRRNALLYLDLDEVSELGDRLAQAQPFLGTLSSEPSLRGLFRLISLAIDGIGSEAITVDLTKTLGAIAEVVEAQVAGRHGILSWQSLITGDGNGEPPYRRLILIQPSLDYGSLQPATAAIAALRAIAADLDFGDANGVQMRLTGSAALAQEELKSVEEGMGLAAALAIFLVLCLLYVGLRSMRLVVAALATLVFGLIWTTAFAVAVVGHFNLISVAFAVLFIGLSVDFGIHFSLRYREAIESGATHTAALGATASSVGGALTLSAIAAAIGFLSFLPTAYVGLAELGLIAGAGMFIALFANMTVLPALMSLAPIGSVSEGRFGAGRDVTHDIFRRRTRTILWTALTLGLGAAAVVPLARFDFDPLNLRDPESESVATLVDLMSDTRTSPYAITILADSLDVAKQLAARLQLLETVDATVSLADFVPAEQDEKLAVIEEMALFLLPALIRGEKASVPTTAQQKAALIGLRARLDILAASAPQNRLTSAGQRLSKALSLVLLSAADRQSLDELEGRLLGSLPSQLGRVRESLQGGQVRLEDLPQDLVERQIANDGRARLQVFPTENLRDREAQRRFVHDVVALAPAATGAPVVIFEAGNAVVAAFLQAALTTAVLVLVLLLVVLRSLRDSILVFAPLVLSAVLTVAASVVLDLPFNFANVIVLPLLFGLGVASGIHMVLRARDRTRTVDVSHTSTPRAVLFSALTTIGSFASIALSSHPGMASMGVLLTIAITFTLLSSLIVLPALMIVFPMADGHRSVPHRAKAGRV